MNENNDTTTTSPAPSLLKAWGKRMSQGNATIIPVFVGGAWSLQVPRGNKRILRVQVSGRKPAQSGN
ncbi:MAG: hypothetical protein NTX64_03955 [Elusimicrobia bacterium]|nr:hypothetical protein [Elusimicrobiota bacterium]